MEFINTIIAVFAFVLSIIGLILIHRKPKITLSYIDTSPYKKLLMVQNDPRSFPLELFIRVKIENKSSVLAKNCIGKIVEWYTNNELVKDFDPVKLHWVTNEIDDFSTINLAKNEFEYLDIIRTAIDLKQLILQTDFRPKGSPIIFKDSDEHIFKIVIHCEGSSTVPIWFRIKYQKHDPNDELAWINMEKIKGKNINQLISS
jgi:hypothetical protein